MAWLRILSGRGQGSTFDIGQRTFTLGRSPGNFVQLVASDVSRRHCQFRWEGARCLLLDLNSQNGLFVNGERVSERVLSDGDRIGVGKTVVEFRSGSEMPGAEDHARRFKEIRAEVTGGSTTSLRQEDLSGILGRLRVQASGFATSPAPAAASSTPASTTSGPASRPGVFPEDDARRFLEHLGAVPAGETLATFLGEVATGAGRLMRACRVCVLLRRLDAAGSPFLAPALTWVRPELAAGARDRPLLSDVVRRSLSESAAVGEFGNGPDAPTCALAVPLVASTTWFGLLYVDSFEPAPGPFAQPHLEFLVGLSARASGFLASRGAHSAQLP